MPSTNSLLDKLQRDFPAYTFTKGSAFHWSPDTATVFYKNATDTASLLHEVAHAVLGHTQYVYDIDLLKMEREAWEYTVSHLSPRYNVSINDEDIETALTTYRDWLHDRSCCPRCHATGIQHDIQLYACLSCGTKWRVNEARSRALRRYVLTSKSHDKK